MTQQITPTPKEIEKTIKDWAASAPPPNIAEGTLQLTPISDTLKQDIEAWAKPYKT